MENRHGTIVYRVLYAQAIYGEPEKRAVVDSLDNNYLVSGPKTLEFERRVSELFGKKHGIAVNSGSSANLLAISASGLPPGCEVITPACTFSTTVSPIIQLGFVPVFVDCSFGTYVVDPADVEAAITPRTGAIVVPQLCGSVCEIDRLREVADRHRIWLIEDCCDAIGPRLHGKAASIHSDVTTTSFYGSHLITTMGCGGMILTDHDAVSRKAIALRDWGRLGDDRENFNLRFSCELDGFEYDAKSVYLELGYNFRLSEAAAAFGLKQLDRLPAFRAARESNFRRLLSYFRAYDKWFHQPRLIEGAESTWLAFPLTFRESCPFSRRTLLEHLEERGIQTRVFFSGNITRHPAFRDRRFLIHSKLVNSDAIMRGGFLLGCHPGLDESSLNYMIRSCDEFLSMRG